MQRNTSHVFVSPSPFRFFSRQLAGCVCMLAVCAMPAFTQAKTLHDLPAFETAETQSTRPSSPPLGKATPAAPSVMRGAITENAKLLKVVALARHGVRSPLQQPQELRQWSKKEWPTWPVVPGYLTPRGAELVRYLWSNLREQLSAEGLTAAPDAGCPPVGSVFVHADNEERTRATATALLEGFAPGCGLSYVYSDNEGQLVTASSSATSRAANSDAITSLVHHTRPDPLFHPVHDKLCVPSPSDAVNIAAQININDIEQTLRQPLTLMSALVGEARDDFCTRYRARSGCVAPLLPTRIRISADGDPHLDGGLGIASSLAEIWLLEAAQWPDTNPAWNGLDTANLQRLLPVHTLPFNAVQRSSAIAKSQGSALLSAMVTALTSPETPTAASAASLVIFVGHDTSIAHVASLLGLDWKTQSWPENAVPPGAMLLLSLWEREGQQIVTASFVTQSLSVMRSGDPHILSQSAPEWANPSLHGTAPSPSGPALPLNALLAKLPTIINFRCL